MTSEFYEEGEFEGLPADPKKRELIKGYVNDALAQKQAKALATLREKEVYKTIEADDKLEIELDLFKSIVAYAYEKAKKQKALSKLEAAKEGAELLGLIAQ